MQNLLLQCGLYLHSTCEIKDCESRVADCCDLLVCDMSLGQWRQCYVECGTIILVLCAVWYHHIHALRQSMYYSCMQETGGDTQVSAG
jgi:hypothetical protein